MGGEWGMSILKDKKYSVDRPVPKTSVIKHLFSNGFNEVWIELTKLSWISLGFRGLGWNIVIDNPVVIAELKKLLEKESVCIKEDKEIDADSMQNLYKVLVYVLCDYIMNNVSNKIDMNVDRFSENNKLIFSFDDVRIFLHENVSSDVGYWLEIKQIVYTKAENQYNDKLRTYNYTIAWDGTFFPIHSISDNIAGNYEAILNTLMTLSNPQIEV